MKPRVPRSVFIYLALAGFVFGLVTAPFVYSYLEQGLRSLLVKPVYGTVEPPRLLVWLDESLRFLELEVDLTYWFPPAEHPGWMVVYLKYALGMAVLFFIQPWMSKIARKSTCLDFACVLMGGVGCVAAAYWEKRQLLLGLADALHVALGKGLTPGDFASFSIPLTGAVCSLCAALGWRWISGLARYLHSPTPASAANY